MGAKSAQRGQAAAQQEAGQDEQIANLEAQQAAASQQQAPPAPAPSQADDDAAQIQKYAALKGQGLITEEEFEAKKKQILGI
ncbi:MAG TPA: SHOCT domain-containing protein [Solirubrobacteraceae bacterium]|nr:SHOCT domain-containing protein [Solirubrobacteraceae bacterium]